MKKILYVLERVFRMTNLPVRYYDSMGNKIYISVGSDTNEDPLETDLELKERLIGNIQKRQIPYIHFEGDVTFGGCKGISNGVVIIGPICRNKLNDKRKCEYAKRHNLTEAKIQLQRGTIDKMCAILSLLYYEIVGKEIREEDILIADSITNKLTDEYHYKLLKYEMDYNEQETPRLNYKEEQRFMTFVENGDSDAVRAILGESIRQFDEYMVGNLANASLKQYEYMACSLIVLASRAAIKGGIDALSSYLLADLYMQQLEKCTKTSEMIKLMMIVIQEYTDRVRINYEERSQNSYVEQSKHFIISNLNKPFQVSDVAKKFGIDRTYLSKKFAKSEGICIQQFIRKKRVEAAANMLKYSNESILNISNYYYFTSQSYFGKVFKEQMGLTPQQFRNKYQLVDFKMEKKYIL